MKRNESSENTTYYDDKYFKYQKNIGEFGGWANKRKFISYVAPTDTVIDFGCGGGFLLKQINCARKIGIELNDTARDFAEKTNSIQVVKYVDDLDDSVADVIISNHALEHCHSPHAELSKLLQKLKPGGLIVFYVPSESSPKSWTPGDIHMHIYTWNPNTLGNLFSSVGFDVESAKMFYHFWPRYYTKVAMLGWPIFNLICCINGLLKKKYSQVRVVARRRL
jgi:SAM-dependent methyltransferase